MEQGSDEWMEMRRGKIGASDAPKIMGVSPYGTALQLWQEKMGLREPKKRTAAMQYGIDKEAPAREEFTRETGIVMVPAVKVHPIYDWMMASYDGLSECGKWGLEIKHCNADDFACAKRNVVPVHYFPQLQQQIEVHNLEGVYYMAVHKGATVWFKVLPDRPYIQELITALKAFWECMETFTPPEACEKDFERRDDDQWCDLASRWKVANSRLKQAEEEVAILKEELIKLADGSNILGGGVQLTVSHRRGSIDYKKIPELNGVDVEQYRKKPLLTHTLKIIKE